VEETLAEKPSTETSTAVVQKKPWWVVPSIIAGCVGGVVIAFLHVHFGSSTQSTAIITAAGNISIFLVMYMITRRMKPKHTDSSLVGLLVSLAVSLPVFVIAFFGLGYEVAQFADLGAAYIAGAWLGSAEAAEMMV
jgi:hypothetical protein